VKLMYPYNLVSEGPGQSHCFFPIPTHHFLPLLVNLHWRVEPWPWWCQGLDLD
jgi:hypothetical protein